MLKGRTGLNMAVKKAVFLDKDGTLIPDIPFNIRTDLIRLSAYSIDGLRLLQDKGYIFIVVTNQPGIAKGYFSHQDMLAVEGKLELLLGKAGIVLSGFYYCPHAPTLIGSAFGGCNCRKPKPGLLRLAAREHHIDLQASWMIGDILHDIEAGNLAGCKTVLIDNGNETEWIMTDGRTPDSMVPNLNKAANYILQMDVLANNYKKNIY